MKSTHQLQHRYLRSWLILLLAGAMLLLGGCVSQAELRSKKALEMWRERCKNAGITINRTVEDVEGIFVLKHRPESLNFGDQFLMDDPYGSDLSGEDYVWSFVYGSGSVEYGPRGNTTKFQPGYKYADAVDPKTGIRYRYSGRNEVIEISKERQRVHTKFIEIKEPTTAPTPRYGITYADISTREEREYWIAGSALSIIDLQTGEVLAQRIGYMVDLGQGSTAGGRSPWFSAADYACPKFPKKPGFKGQSIQALRLALQVLTPKLD